MTGKNDHIILGLFKAKLITVNHETGVVYNRYGKPTGSKNHNGYLRTNLWFEGKRYRLRIHRIIYVTKHGEQPELEIDHLNQITDDNRLCNLEAVTKEENRRRVEMRAVENELPEKPDDDIPF